MRKKTAVFTFFVIIMLGMIFQVIGREHELHGVSEETPLSVSAGGLWDGSSQSDMEAWLDGKLVLRTWLIPIRNQIVYSVFHTSTNDEVVLGKNDTHCLFSSHRVRRMCIQRTYQIYI